MRRVLVISLLAARIAAAQPGMTAPSPETYQQCKARRHAELREARKLESHDARLEAYKRAPRCDGDYPDAPYQPHAVFAVRGGIHSSGQIIEDDAPQGRGPFVNVEAGMRRSRRSSATLYAGYSYFRDDSVYDANTDERWNVTEHLVDLELRATLHVGGFSLGAGAGLELERSSGYNDHTKWRVWPLVELFTGATFSVTPRYQVTITGGLALANVIGFPFGFAGYRLSAGVQF